MKSYRKELHFHLPARRGLVNITSQVRQALEESGIQEEIGRASCRERVCLYV